MRHAGILALALLALLPAQAAAQPDDQKTPDALDQALDLAGLSRGDLGWTPKGWWPRFPADIPYKLRAFDALFA